MKNKYLYLIFLLIFIGLLITIIYLTFIQKTENFADNADAQDDSEQDAAQDTAVQDADAKDDSSKDDIPKIDVQQSDTQVDTSKSDDKKKEEKKAPLKVLDDTERKLYEKELDGSKNYKDLDLKYDKIYEGGRELKQDDVDKDKQKITKLPIEKDLENRQLYKDPNENLEDSSKSDKLIDIDEDLTVKDKSDIVFPKKENVVKYDFFKCNLDVDAESEPVDKKKYPCNASIHERYMYGCRQGEAFPTELQQSVGSNYDKIIEDPSDFYKKINRPIMGAVDNFDWNPSNMVDYSNTANYYDIGKIPLDKNKVIPVQYNYAFKNSPSFSFI